jgi:hypothetical protein
MTALGPGSRVKCIHQGKWFDVNGRADRGPDFGSVWTVDFIIPEAVDANGKHYPGPWVVLREWIPYGKPINPRHFVPLDGNEDISALIGALKKGPVEGDKQDERVRIVERVR